MHMFLFGILGFLFGCTLRPNQGASALVRIMVITLIVALYEAFNEIHQVFVDGWEASLEDMAADMAEGLVSALIFRKRRGGV